MEDRGRVAKICAAVFVLSFGAAMAGVLLDPKGVIIPELGAVSFFLGILIVASLAGLCFFGPDFGEDG